MQNILRNLSYTEVCNYYSVGSRSSERGCSHDRFVRIIRDFINTILFCKHTSELMFKRIVVITILS